MLRAEIPTLSIALIYNSTQHEVCSATCLRIKVYYIASHAQDERYPYPAAKMSYAKFLVCYYFRSAFHRELVKILSECQTAWMRKRRQVTRRLIRMQAVCVRDYGRNLQDKCFVLGFNVS